MKNSISSRERVRIALEHEQPDRVPTDVWFTPEIADKLKKHLGVETEDDIRNKLDIDIRWYWADYEEEGRRLSDGNVRDRWGVVRKSVKNQFAAYDEFVSHPLAEAKTVKEINNYDWPLPDRFDYGELKKKIEDSDRMTERWIGVGESSIFERAWAMTGMEKFLMDLAVAPEIPIAIMDKINDFYIEQTTRTLEATEGRADMIYIGDDVGSQNGMLFSPDMWREYIKPRQRKFNDSIKENFPRIKFQYHSCGSIVPIIDDLIEIGVNILNPIQPRAKGMEPSFLKANYGKRLSFCGGIDIQELLPKGKPDDIRQEVKRYIAVLGMGGGYILAPSHAIQPDTPIENILALFETGETSRFEV